MQTATPPPLYYILARTALDEVPLKEIEKGRFTTPRGNRGSTIIQTDTTATNTTAANTTATDTTATDTTATDTTATPRALAQHLLEPAPVDTPHNTAVV